ncbi:MAG: hypothetical protein D4R63_10450 [Methylococcaceae bacterium]|nr:MAG: hypothetical protein D4R63_10450 [Methylococcaceae bacterium]
MNDSQQNKCHAIIHGAATVCAGIAAGMAQIPGSDSVFIVPVQVGMIVSLGAVFGIELDESAAKATLATATATMVGRGISQVLLGWIPGYGNALNASTAFAVTESIGWAVANGFAAKQPRLTYR